MKFTDMKYERPDMDALKEKSHRLTEEMKTCSSAARASALFYDFQKIIFDFRTMAELTEIHHTIDTRDSFYADESDYMDEVTPLFDIVKQEFYRALYDSCHRPALEKEFGSVLFKNIEILLKTMSPDIVKDLQKENRLVTEYTRLCSSARVSYEGKEYTFAQFEPFKEIIDSKARRAAWEADAKGSFSIGEALDRIYDDLVKTRDRIAKTLGYASFTELGYDRMNRNCYSRKEVESFRENVQKYIVPITTHLKKEQAKRLGVDTLFISDAFMSFKDGNPRPEGTPEEIFAAAKDMYHEMSPLTSEFFDFMLETQLFDVISKDNKAGGGYCTFLYNYKSPFIFANFNGTAGDIDVLTHEMGHALNSYLSRNMKISDYMECTSEMAEVHSMSMEYFTRPWMKRFFKEDTDKFLYDQLADEFNMLSYICIVDEFQHMIYENPHMTPGERHNIYKNLETIYRPWLNLDEIEFYKDGRRWQRQLHIYEVPFYYIDYALASTVALQFWAADEKDHEDAWNRYLMFSKAAGTKTFTELVQDVGLISPFEPEALKLVAGAASAWLDKNPV